MVNDVAWYLALLLFFVLERGGELIYSSRNVRRALARGAHEVGQRHYRAMTVLHVLFFLSLLVELDVRRPAFPGAVGAAALAMLGVAQGLRYWSIFTLGERWSTRVLFVPDAAPIVAGPYRFVRHPNYVAVCLELLCLPAAHGLWWTAGVFSAANAVLLWVRIRTEEAALGPAYQAAFGATPRFVPGARHG